jgi:hypothetical protein
VPKGFLFLIGYLVKFSLRQVKLLITDPLCYQMRLEKKLLEISRRIRQTQSEYEREKIFRELEILLCKDISSLLSEKKLAESLEITGMKHLVKSLVSEVSWQRFNTGDDYYVRRLRRANQIIHFAQ